MKQKKIMEKNMKPTKKNIQELIIIKRMLWNPLITMRNKKMKMKMKLRMTMEKKKACNKVILILIQNKIIRY
jgi:hypothetical protein